MATDTPERRRFLRQLELELRIQWLSRERLTAAAVEYENRKLVDGIKERAIE